MTLRVWDLDAGAYARHALHRGDRAWPEVELLRGPLGRTAPCGGRRAAGRAALHARRRRRGRSVDLLQVSVSRSRALYGVDVFELNIWRPLPIHISRAARPGPPRHRRSGRLLPARHGGHARIRREHVKTSIGIQALDAQRRRLGYFHNAGYYELLGGRLRWRLPPRRPPADPMYLPPYVEVAKLDARPRRVGPRAASTRRWRCFAAHLARRPTENPFRRYAAAFPPTSNGSPANPSARFHGYAFATLRQCGAAFELAAAYLRWLEAVGERGLASVRRSLRPHRHHGQDAAVQGGARRQRPSAVRCVAVVRHDGRGVGRHDDGARPPVRLVKRIRHGCHPNRRLQRRAAVTGPLGRRRGDARTCAAARPISTALRPGLAAVRRTDDGGGGAARSRPVGRRASARLRRRRLVVPLPLHAFRQRPADAASVRGSGHRRRRLAQRDATSCTPRACSSRTRLMSAHLVGRENELRLRFHALEPLLSGSASAPEVAHRTGGTPAASLVPHHTARTHADAGVRPWRRSDRGVRFWSNPRRRCRSSIPTFAPSSTATTGLYASHSLHARWVRLRADGVLSVGTAGRRVSCETTT